MKTSLLSAALAAVLLLPPMAEAVLLLGDGSLIKSQGDERVYYLENGTKRWIDSAETFWAQGFLWEDIRTISLGDLAAYREGAPISSQTQMIMPGEAEGLPDLLMLPPFNFHFATRFGRTILKFSSTFWNAGKGPLELISNASTVSGETGASQNVYQRIVRNDGSERRRFAGSFVWHDEHDHYHFHDFVDYLFSSLDSPDIAPLMQEKTTRCIRDWDPIDLGIKGAAQEKMFPKCTNDRQGVSVGWGDLYEYTLADQYLDVHDMPKGNYRLRFQVNPRNILIESRTDNNISFADLRLDAQKKTMEVVEFAAPCWHNWHKLFPEGTLVRSEGDTRVYVIHRGKKRWLRTQDIFNSYGYAWEKIQDLPESIVDSIPYNNLIRVDGIKVYALNDFGYKRHLQSPEAFFAYGFRGEDVADINQTEFTGYADASFIQRVGDTAVYRIEGSIKQLLTVSNGFQPEELHVINDLDFQSYLSQ